MKIRKYYKCFRAIFPVSKPNGCKQKATIVLGKIIKVLIAVLKIAFEL
jgi:hypothetical protein